MGLADYHRIGLRIGATEVTTTTETQTVSPFSLDQLRAKGTAIVKARTSAGNGVPYYVIAFTPITQNKDVSTHIEPFDVDATEPDPSSSRYKTDAEARDAAIHRYNEIKSAMGPYCYVAIYHATTEPPMIDDNFVPPPQQQIETKTSTSTKTIVAAGAGLIATIGILALMAKH